MASTSTKRIWWDGWQCQKNGAFPTVEILGKKTPVNPLTVDAWLVLSHVLSHHGYVAKSVWNYNCRKITGGSGYSLHAYGIATDIDPKDNPYIRTRKFSWAATRFTKEQIDAVHRVKTNTGKQVFLWGGYWSSIKDYMHFEIDVPPKDLSAGISLASAGIDPRFGTPDLTIVPKASSWTTYPGTVTETERGLRFSSTSQYGRFVTRDEYQAGVEMGGTIRVLEKRSNLKPYDGIVLHAAHKSNKENIAVNLVRADRNQSIKRETPSGYKTLAGVWGGNGPHLETGVDYPFRLRWTPGWIEASVTWRGKEWPIAASTSATSGAMGFRFDGLTVEIRGLTLKVRKTRTRELTLKRGDKGDAVKFFQQALMGWNPNALPEFKDDGDYGGETEEWVKKYQGAADLQVTGVIDGVVAALLARFHPSNQIPKLPDFPEIPEFPKQVTIASGQLTFE